MILRILFLSVFIVHGILHLLGFLKAFRLAEVPTLQTPIGRPMGLLWLLAFLLFVLAIILNTVSHQSWWIPALLAVLLSQLLIFSAWSDAKWGTLANIILLVSIVPAAGKWQFDRRVRSEMNALWSSVSPAPTAIDTARLHVLPAPVRNWLDKSGALDRPPQHTVWLKQKARLKLSPDQESWIPASAVQFFSTDPPTFLWKVNMKMNGLLPVSGRDRFVDGKGHMLIKLLSLFPVADATGPKIDEGTLQRYLGETIWIPTALLHPAITWEPIDSTSVQATLTVGSTTGSGRFHFNQEGDMVRFTAQRFQGNEPDAKRIPWIIDVKDWKRMDNVRIPSRGTVTWATEKGDWTWLELEIVDLEYTPKPPLKGF